jgi:hypothetical protein
VAVKAPSPLLGFNNNVRHKGRVFHIQTEDSGIRHPHVITHLFADGGRILKSTKTSYAEHVGQDKLGETVRAMMQEQHKAMFIALRDGQFDYLFDENAAKPAAPPPAPSAPQAAPQAPPPVAPPPAPSAPTRAQQLESAALSPTAPALAAVSAPEPHAPMPPAVVRAADPPIAAAPLVESAPPSRRRASGRPTLEVDPAAIHRTPPRRSADPGAIDLDLDALERAAVEAQTPFFQQIQDLPPPPAAVLGQKRAPSGPGMRATGDVSPGGYSVRTTPAAQDAVTPPPRSGRETSPFRPSAEPPHRSSPRPPPAHSPHPPPAPPTPPPAARYAPSRPASIFATTRPQEGTSIFGEDLISEKSLDEVILGYLAEDLDAPGDKK